MTFRRAGAEDLPRIQSTYREVIAQMRSEGIGIWDDVYPSETIPHDVEKGRFYILEDGETVVSGFAVSLSHVGNGSVRWAGGDSESRYLDRFAVHPGYLHRGIGGEMIRKAREIAAQERAPYLRLFVVDFNEPAIRLYEKSGFVRADGTFDCHVLEGVVLYEFGYEIPTK